MKALLSIPLAAILISSLGCGGSIMSNCGPVGLNVGPATATVSHAAAVPGNSQTFSASFQFRVTSGCAAITAALVNSNWTVSDPSVHLSATQGTMVTATCTATLASPATVTATPADGEMFTGKAALTCN